VSERLLIVDDEESSRELCRLVLEGEDRELVLCSDAQAALEALSRNTYDLVLTDMIMPGLTGMELLERIRAERLDTPVVLMSGKGSIPMVVQAMRLGAEDFIEKPFPDPEVVALSVNRALRRRRLEEENRSLRRELQTLKGQPHMVGGEAMSQVLRTLERIAPLELTVLITGETGTGKEMIARRLHALSPRADKPFVALNCGGLPEGLLESLLFGHEKGAFTGAIKRTAGYFEKAHKGTILLDEIGDMPLPLQVKLLRVLQEKNFQRVGGEGTIPVDCRVIASTHRDLRRMVTERTFREDLYYRLNVLHLNLPPLRDRREDIPSLARYFIRQISGRLGRPVTALAPEALDRLKAHRWPGNIRELENCLERAIALSSGDRLEAGDLPEELRHTGQSQAPPGEVAPYGPAKEAFERRYLDDLMASCSGCVSAAARVSGIPRQNLYLKLKKHGLHPSETRPDPALDEA